MRKLMRGKRLERLSSMVIHLFPSIENKFEHFTLKINGMLPAFENTFRI